MIDDIIDRLPESYNAVEVRRKIVIAEKIILRTIHWQVGMPTIDTFLQRFAQAGRLNSVCTSLARCISERSLLEYEMINFNPSEIAAASICVARSLEKHAPWNSTLVHYTGYTQENLRPCVECLQNIFHNEMNARAKNYVFKLVEEMGLDRSILLRCLRLLPSLSPDCLLGAISNDPNVATIDRLTVDNDMTQLAANTLMELTFQSSNARSVVGHGTGNDSTIYDNTNFAFARYNSTGSMSPAADHQKRLRENRILSYQSLIRTILKSDDDFVSDLSSLFFELLGHYRSCCENGNDLTTVRVDDLNNAELQDILIEKISTGVTLSTVFDSVKDRYQHVYDRIVTCPP